MIVPIWLAVAAASPGLLASAYVWRRYSAYLQHKGARKPGMKTVLDAMGHEALQVTRLVRYGVRSAVTYDPPPRPEHGPPVVCVHGYTMNGSNFVALRTELTARGRASRAVSLGLPGRRVGSYAPRLAEVLASCEGPFDVVAHSMGGIVLRLVLRDHPEIAARVRRIITLGTPHSGTAGARGWPSWLPEPSDLHRRSPLLAALPHLAELAPHARILTVGASMDLVVYPPETTAAPGSVHLELPVGHLGLVLDPGVARQLADWLAAPSE